MHDLDWRRQQQEQHSSSHNSQQYENDMQINTCKSKQKDHTRQAGQNNIIYPLWPPTIPPPHPTPHLAKWQVADGCLAGLDTKRVRTEFCHLLLSIHRTTWPFPPFNLRTWPPPPPFSVRELGLPLPLFQSENLAISTFQSENLAISPFQSENLAISTFQSENLAISPFQSENLACKTCTGVWSDCAHIRSAVSARCSFLRWTWRLQQQVCRDLMVQQACPLFFTLLSRSHAHNKHIIQASLSTSTTLCRDVGNWNGRGCKGGEGGGEGGGGGGR